MKNRTHDLVLRGLLLAAAIVLQMVEPMFPIGAPGIKLGLANTMGLIALWIYGPVSAVLVNLLRVFICGILRGNLLGPAFWLSFSGTFLATMAEIVVKKFTKMSVTGLSIAGSVFHSLGQILAVCYLYQNRYMIAYLPIMWMIGIISGFITGVLAVLVIQRVERGGAK